MKVLFPNFKKRGGLVTVIAQDSVTLQVLMVAYTDEAGFLETLETGEAVYWSTSREERWKKGETSGDVQIVKNILVDCDGDAVVYQIEQTGKGACHTEASSCFYRSVFRPEESILPAPKAGEKDELSSRDVPVLDRFQ